VSTIHRESTVFWARKNDFKKMVICCLKFDNLMMQFYCGKIACNRSGVPFENARIAISRVDSRSPLLLRLNSILAVKLYQGEEPTAQRHCISWNKHL
jgi:hypothetical protein